MIKQWFA